MGFTGGTVVATAKAAMATTDVASTSAEAIAIAREAQIQLLRQYLATTETATTGMAATPATSIVPQAITVGLLAELATVGAGMAVGAGIALLPVAAAYAAEVADRLGDNGGISLPGGLPETPATDPSRPDSASAPGADAGSPALLPGSHGPGAASAPGQSNHALVLSGVRIPLTPGRAERLTKAEEADQWTDLPGTDRTSLGKAYDHILLTLVRAISGGGRATVLHYVHVTKALLEEMRTTVGGRLIITQGRLRGGSLRFDLAEIDFDRGTVDLIDLTALHDPRHASKNTDYETDLADLTGFPVAAYEARYVDENKVADEVVIVPTSSK
jgi:hypothetical protein